jgi:hypothetical protein
MFAAWPFVIVSIEDLEAVGTEFVCVSSAAGSRLPQRLDIKSFWLVDAGAFLHRAERRSLVE